MEASTEQYAPWATDEAIRGWVEQRRATGTNAITLEETGDEPPREEVGEINRAITDYVEQTSDFNATAAYGRVQRAFAAVTELPLPIGQVVTTRALTREMLATDENEERRERLLANFDRTTGVIFPLPWGWRSWPSSTEDVRSPHALAQDWIARHEQGDWGDLDPEDRRTNETALKTGQRIMSVYKQALGERDIWVITEWDRSITTILFPEDY